MENGGAEVEMRKSASKFIMSDDLLVGRNEYHVARQGSAAGKRDDRRENFFASQ